MIITLFGENAFGHKSELDKLIADFDTNESLALQRIDDPSTSLEDLKQSLLSYSLFSDKKMVILDEPSKIKGFSEEISELADALPETTNLVIIEPTLDRRGSYYKFLNSSSNFRSFNKLAGSDLINWVVKYATEMDGQIKRTEAEHLINRVGDDQMLLSQEIAKLILYSKTISNQTIDLLTEPSPDSTIFELLDAAFNGSTSLALNLYEDQRRQKVEPEQIIAMMSWQLQTMALTMTSRNLTFEEVTQKTKLNPFVLRKAKQITDKLSFSRLKTMVSDLTQIDMRSKTGSFDLDEGLKNFIVSLSYLS